MSDKDIRPTSIVGIKRLAKTLKAEMHISHHEALDQAARRAGFQNFRHANNTLPPAGGPGIGLAAPAHRLYITGYWKDRDSGVRGRETTWVDISVPWEELVTRTQMQAHRALVRLIPEAQDHVSYQYMFSSQSETRRSTAAAVRTFQFMDATRLRPTDAHSRVYPGGSSMNAIPGRDHYSIWYDAQSKGYVFVDEPYEPSAIQHGAERAAWALRHDYDIVRPNWPGMYNPGEPGDSGGSRLYLIISKTKGPALAPLAQALDKLPFPMLEENWKGDSAPGMERFKSPAEIRRANEPVQPPKPRAPRREAPAHAARQARPPRPGRMPITVHEDIGRKLKTVMADTYERDGVRNRLDRVRSELDDWIQREYDDIELPMKRFSEVYYGSSPNTTFAKTLNAQQRTQHAKTLDEIKVLLDQYYPLSQLRPMLQKIDSAQKSLQRWES